MTTTLRTLPMMAKLVLVVGLLCRVIFAQVANAQPVALTCTVAGPSQMQATAGAGIDCRNCCAAMPCCLLSKTAPDVPAHPEPLSGDRNSPLDHAPVAVVFTSVPIFDFLVPPQQPGSLARNRVIQPTWECAPRGAVSCIWLI